MQRVASSMSTAQLKDQLQALVNSMGQATRLFEEHGDPLAIDVVLDNLANAEAVAAELQGRLHAGEGYAPVPDPKLAALTEEFLRRRALAGAPVPQRSLVELERGRPVYRRP